MTSRQKAAIRNAGLALFLLAGERVHAEYLRIQLKVFGLDCQLCARGVSKSVERLAGVEIVNVSLRTGMLEVVLKRGNKIKMSDLRKRIKENGYRPMEAKVTAIGAYAGDRFHVVGPDEWYDVGRPASSDATAVELTFDVR